MNRKRTHTHRLALEVLEDRVVLTAGDLDLTFGASGIVTTDFGREELAAIDLAPDGKIVAGGFARLGPNGFLDFALSRYLSDGSLDAAFGVGGRLSTAFGGTAEVIMKDVSVLPDSRVLAAGYRANDFLLVRYTASGAVDTTFGGKAKGKVVTDIASGSYDMAKAMVVRPDGKTVVGGVTTPRNSTGIADLALVRYNANGSLDTSFDADGKLTVRFANPLDRTFSGQSVVLAVYPPTAPGGLAGKLLAVVQLQKPGVGPDIVLTRFNTDGSRDASFGGGTGSVTFGSGRSAPTVAIQPDGKIVLSARGSESAGELGIILARYDTAGNLDTGFGSGGETGLDFFESDSKPKSLALQPDGKIVMSSYQYDDDRNVHDPLVARFTANGSLDPTFGTDGVAIQTVASFDIHAAIDIAIQADGRIVLAGTNGTGSSHFVLMRLQGDAALTAARPAPAPCSDLLSANEAHSLLGEAVRRWQSSGSDVAALHNIDLRIADLGGATLGLASGSTIWLDDDAAGWGWYADATPWDDSEFITPGDQGEAGRMDLLSVVMHELGHVLGLDHNDHDDDVMYETLAAGERQLMTDNHDLALMSLGIEFDQTWARPKRRVGIVMA